MAMRSFVGFLACGYQISRLSSSTSKRAAFRGLFGATLAMNQHNPAKALDSIIARYRKRIETVQRIRDIIGDDATLVHDILNALGAGSNVQLERHGLGPHARMTHADQVLAFFRDRQNEWVSAREIMQGTGLNRGTVGHLLYKTLKRKVEKRDHPTNEKTKLWRVKEGGDEREKS
jgi:hypothetical protein